VGGVEEGGRRRGRVGMGSGGEGKKKRKLGWNGCIESRVASNEFISLQNWTKPPMG